MSLSVEKMFNDKYGETYIGTAYRRKFIRKTAKSIVSVGFLPPKVEKNTSKMLQTPTLSLSVARHSRLFGEAGYDLNRFKNGLLKGLDG